MIGFLQYITEARRSKSSISPSRKEFLERQKKPSPSFSDDEIDDHINSNFKYELRDKVKNSAHDPHAPIDMTRPIPESVRALGRAVVYHFEDGIRKKDKKQIVAASRLMKSHIGDHYHELMVDNKTRHIVKSMFAKDN